MLKKVIVTGATSFLGRACVQRLLEAGCLVVALVRPGSVGLPALEKIAGALGLSGQGRLIILPLALDEIGTLKNRLPWGRILRFCSGEGSGVSFSAWLHLGWDGAGSKNRLDVTLQLKNVGYALAALDTAADLGCRRFLFSGSQAEYGICRSLMSEDRPCRPVSPYARAKVLVGERAGQAAIEKGLTYIHTRIFSVYGPGDHPWSLVSACVDTFLRDKDMALGACTQSWNFLHVRDTAKVLTALLLGTAPAGVYNVAGEDTRPLKNYVDEIYALCGYRGHAEFGKRPPNAEGDISLLPDLTKLKSAGAFCQEIAFSEGIKELVGLKKAELSL